MKQKGSLTVPEEKTAKRGTCSTVGKVENCINEIEAPSKVSPGSTLGFKTWRQLPHDLNSIIK